MKFPAVWQPPSRMKFPAVWRTPSRMNLSACWRPPSRMKFPAVWRTPSRVNLCALRRTPSRVNLCALLRTPGRMNLSARLRTPSRMKLSALRLAPIVCWLLTLRPLLAEKGLGVAVAAVAPKSRPYAGDGAKPQTERCRCLARGGSCHLFAVRGLSEVGVVLVPMACCAMVGTARWRLRSPVGRELGSMLAGLQAPRNRKEGLESCRC